MKNNSDAYSSPIRSGAGEHVARATLTGLNSAIPSVPLNTTLFGKCNDILDGRCPDWWLPRVVVSDNSIRHNCSALERLLRLRAGWQADRFDVTNRTRSWWTQHKDVGAVLL